MKPSNLCLVALLLGVLSVSAKASNQALADACIPLNESYLNSGFGNMTTDNSGIWTWDSWNYAKARKEGGGVAHLFTPALNLSGAESATVAFAHVHRYAENPANDYTLWVTPNWQGSFDASTWQQLIIDPYANNSSWYDWKDVSIDVPVAFLGANTVFAFQYTSSATVNGTWEIKNLTLTSTCPTNSGDDLTPPVVLPELGDGRLIVCGQNLRNYYFNYQTNDRPEYNTPEGFAEKTRKIISMMRMVDADIYAFCELEAQDIILRQLTDSLNTHIGETEYAYVTDDIDVPNETRTNNIKSGFIYRISSVRPIGANLPAYNAWYYGETMRVQAFEEITTGERFTLSMNHFKAKDSSEDQGNATRVTNATRLVQNLPGLALDPDILILGDLNCEPGEQPLSIIDSAGYVEQLLRFDPGAYSHCWNWSGELIDHVYANTTMAAQITGAGLFHITTACENDANANEAYRYSDHDPYLVALNLISEHPTECEEIQYSYLPTGGTGLGEMGATSISGTWYWQYNASYGATCRDTGGEDWLTTPAYDLSLAEAVTLEFDHTIGYAHNMPTEQTLWVTSDYSGVATSRWTQIVIPTYPTGTNYTFVHATVNVPKTLVGSNTAFAFKYDVPAEADSRCVWEIKNLQVNVSCTADPSGLDHGSPKADEPTAGHRGLKLLDSGHLFILLPDGTRYDATGKKLE